MALPLTGAWQRKYAIPYSGALSWGTGINPVHQQYGEGPPLRQTSRRQREGEHTPAPVAIPDSITEREPWGSTHDDSSYAGVAYDARPDWGEDPGSSRGHSGTQPPWNVQQSVNETFRGTRGGARRTFRAISPKLNEVAYVIPTETVSEGWINKPQGNPANAKPSDPSQYEMQTSMAQRNQTRVNEASVSRGTDKPREPILSRITGQKEKVYSGGERHYDMLPKEQDVMPRPFYYRTAGTGRAHEMLPNEMWQIDPIQRTPPPDPSYGPEETKVQQDYGYTTEDHYYA